MSGYYNSYLFYWGSYNNKTNNWFVIISDVFFHEYPCWLSWK